MPEPAHGELPPLPHGVPRPEVLERDFGEPQGWCTEGASSSGTGIGVDSEATGSGVFERTWSEQGVIKIDCNAFTTNLKI